MAKFYCPTKLSEKISETPEGYLLCLGVPIARTGVMEYGEGETPLEVGEDGKVHVSRDAEEVFRPATMASFEGKSVTIKHPENFVGPDNWKELTKGTLHNVRRGKEKDEDGEESLLSDVLITEAFAISLVKNGLREVSCGYEAEYEQTGKGKGKQTNIVGNHLALVEEGRAGSSYAIHDHKGKVTMGKSIAEKFKKLLGKAIDEAVAEGEKPAKKVAAKAKTKSKDEAVTEKVSKRDETNTVMDEDKAYDELKKMYDDMGEKLSAMKPKAHDDDEEKEEKSEDDDEEEKEEKSEDDDEEEKEEKSEDEDEDAEILERVKALEAAVSKLLEMEEKEAQDDDESEESESEDDDDLEGEEGEESQKKTGDAKPVKKTGLEKTKSVDTKPVTFESFDSTKEEMTPEKMNELNAAHWARK